MFGNNILKDKKTTIKLSTTTIKQVETINIWDIFSGQNLTWQLHIQLIKIKIL